ncbi:MAG: hypothetical protein IJ617_05620 [Oscillospiraceae bacterium]|nr:hypothetical protein [Oscillospiraceae bacterium]
MPLAVLAGSRAEADAICARIRSARPGRGGRAEPLPFFAQDEFFSSLQSGRCRAAIIALGDSAGFLAARRLRELDQSCPVLVIDDTERYALQCIRIHVTGFLVRPVSDGQLERALALLLG